MDGAGRFKLHQLMTVSGSFIVLFPIGALFFWGNLSVYTLSYFLMHDTPVSVSQSMWLASAAQCAISVFVLLGGYLVSVIGVRKTIVCGITLSAIGFTGCFYVLDTSFLVFVVFFGVLVGAGSGVVLGPALESTLRWTKSSSGGIVALVQTAPSCGGAVINEIVTLFINPHNELPLYRVGSSKFFSQVDIVQRVPWMFLYLGIGSTVLQLTGLCLLRDPPSQRTSPSINNRIIEQEDTSSSSDPQKDALCRHDSTHDVTQTPTKRGCFTEESLMRILSSKTFGAFWITAGICEVTVIITSSYYKQVGQTTIADDHFLTTLGTTAIVTMCAMRMATGFVMDRIGVKNALMGLFFILALLGSYFAFCPLVSRWLYFVAANLYQGFTGSLYNSFAPATVAVFGHKNFVIIYGLIWTSGLFLNMLGPILLQYVARSANWFMIFQPTACLSFVGGIIVMICL